MSNINQIRLAAGLATVTIFGSALVVPAIANAAVPTPPLGGAYYRQTSDTTVEVTYNLATPEFACQAETTVDGVSYPAGKSDIPAGAWSKTYTVRGPITSGGVVCETGGEISWKFAPADPTPTSTETTTVPTPTPTETTTVPTPTPTVTTTVPTPTPTVTTTVPTPTPTVKPTTPPKATPIQGKPAVPGKGTAPGQVKKPAASWTLTGSVTSIKGAVKLAKQNGVKGTVYWMERGPYATFTSKYDGLKLVALFSDGTVRVYDLQAWQTVVFDQKPVAVAEIGTPIPRNYVPKHAVRG